MRKIPVFEPTLTPEDAAAVREAVENGFVSGASPLVGRLEVAYAAQCGMPYAVAVSNGTAALELAVAGLSLGPGDEILCPAFTIISCARAILLAGAKPVLVDVDPDTWCVDVDHAAARTGPRTRALLGVHAFGHPYDHAALIALSRRHDVLVIEDAAQAHGARVRVDGRVLPCGGLGDVSIFSFYANKPVTTGEGGMVLLREEKVRDRVRDLSNLFMRGTRRFLHDELGHNYRMSGLQAALGLSQLARLDQTVAKKRHLAVLYRERLATMAEIELQAVSEWAEPIHWMNAIVLSDSVRGDAAEVAALLAQRGVETRPFFVGLHEQPALTARGLFEKERYPVTERLSRRGMYLPSGLSLEESAVEHVVAELRSALSELGRPRAFVPEDLAAGEPKRQNRIPGQESVFGEGFAECYDALYESKDYAAEAALLSGCFLRFARRPVRRLLDLGCGTGRHAAEFTLRGLEVVGVDRSEAMLSIARRRAPDARFVQSDMCAVNLGETFDAVVVLFAALSYQTTPDGILAALRAARRHLARGGLLVADVWMGAASPTGVDAPTRRVARVNGIEWSRTGWIQRDPLAQRVDITYELRRRSADSETALREVHRMHYYSPFELEFALRAAGFSLVHLSKENDLGKAPGANDLTALFVAEAAEVA